jgi:hypothetical protein
VNQIDLFCAPARDALATARRDLGIARAQRRAEREAGDDWTETAAAYLADYAHRVAGGQPFLIEDARDAAGARVPRVENGRAWGGAVRAAARRKWLVRAGYAPARSSNHSPKCLWIAGGVRAPG